MELTFAFIFIIVTMIDAQLIDIDDDAPSMIREG